MLTPEQRDGLIELRRDFHRHPELSHEEHRTSRVIAERLRGIGLDEVRTGVGQTGVFGLLQGGKPGRCVLLRADIDALPLTEADHGQDYRSLNHGVHHACGHDGHTAILLSVAEVLAARKTELAGSVAFAFQPAEERVDGAAGMLRDGVLEPKPDACFGLHLWNEVPVGSIDVRPGPIFAFADAFAIELRSGGGHGAIPHQVPDPIVASAELIVALQTLVSRESPPLEPAVLTIGSIHGGTAPNIIPSRVELQGTLRVFSPQLHRHLVKRMHDLVAGIAQTFRVQGELRMTDTCSACINDDAMADLVRRVGQRVIGTDNVLSSMRTLAADDMSVFLEVVPGCYFFVGGANHERGLDSPHHSPTFDFDEHALEVGVQMLTAVTLEFLSKND
jgi:amidohydrolase